jgi:hypothetical protein
VGNPVRLSNLIRMSPSAIERLKIENHIPKAVRESAGETPNQKESPMSKKKSAPATDGLVVFAFRLTEKDRDKIHEAAGRGKASSFVLDAALKAAEKALAKT